MTKSWDQLWYKAPVIDLRPASDSAINPFDLGVQMRDGAILVPVDLFDYLGNLNVRTGEELVSLLLDFPNSLNPLTGGAPSKRAIERVLERFAHEFPESPLLSDASFVRVFKLGAASPFEVDP